MTTQFRLLGPLEVEGAPSLGGPKQRCLLAVLLLSAGRAVAGERLVEELWGEDPPETASHAVQVYVSKLRTLLAPTGAEIIRRGTGYELVLGDAQLDLLRFQELARSGRRLLAHGAAGPALAAFDEALSLWRGDPLADIDSEPAAVRAWAGLGEERLAVLEDRVDAQLRLDRRVDLAELEELVRTHPFRERLLGQLMLALYRSGRQPDALAAYRTAVARFRDELGLEPGSELRALEAAIIRRDPALAPAPAPSTSRLPAPATPLVGRQAHVELVCEAVRVHARLVTLTGPGGIGKTRLALQAATELAPSFPDGVWFVGLAALRDPKLVESTIARTIELAEGDRLEEHLRERRLLLVLDNFEQLLEAADVVGALLEAASGLKLLVTSRAALRIYGEHELAVPPLTTGEAAELFAQRVRATGRDIGGIPAVDEICARLDRLPLAIELVAARVRDLGTDELVASLDRRLDLASEGPRNLPERQRTLRAAIDWSLDLLAPEAQRVFASLGVFAGGFTGEAADTVCAADTTALAELLEGSLVRRGDDGRYRMLETIREAAAERLDALDRGAGIRRRHAEYHADLAEQLAPALIGDDPEGRTGRSSASTTTFARPCGSRGMRAYRSCSCGSASRSRASGMSGVIWPRGARGSPKPCTEKPTFRRSFGCAGCGLLRCSIGGRESWSSRASGQRARWQPRRRRKTGTSVFAP